MQAGSGTGDEGRFHKTPDERRSPLTLTLSPQSRGEGTRKSPRTEADPMTTDTAIELCRSAALLALMVCGPALLVAMAVGLVIGLVQALTQLQDQSLTFVPKLIALTFVILLLLPWGLGLLTEYATDLIRRIPDTI